MKRGFVRTLWGAYDRDVDYKDHFRRKKMDLEIELAKHCRYLEPFTTYVFGKDNYEYIKGCNIEKNTVKLVSDEPVLWD